MNKMNLLLIFGGESAEHEVSIRSARNVFDALDKQKYDIDIELCYIDRNGKWWLVSAVIENPQKLGALLPVLGAGKFWIDEPNHAITPDVLFPVLHGPNGEDGSVQGLAQLLHIPIVGCGIIGSAVCMDKEITKRLLTRAGITVAPGVVHHREDATPVYAEALEKLGGDALFVKPANLGSSVGVSKVTDQASLSKALEEAHRYDRKVLIERAVKGRELECAVLGNEHPEASVVGEIMPGDEFYSYDEKYAETSNTKTSTRAPLPKETSAKIRAVALAAYKVLECRGLARVDFFLADDGTVYLNEVNTLPGFTSISMYPQLWKASGLDYSSLLDRLVALSRQ
nr:D-alanine--D-alanine ligase [uncultured bacterium]